MPRVQWWKAWVLALALSSGAAHALSSGNDLLQLLRGTVEERTIAMQYINGVVDGLYQAEALSGRAYLCTPSGVTLGQIRDVVHKDLERYPTSRHLGAMSLIYVSLSSAWPCPPAGKK